MSDTFVRTMKNGLVIKGFYAHNQFSKNSSFKIELFVTHSNAPHLWSQVLQHGQHTDSAKALAHEITLLESDLTSHLIDQVPTTTNGLMLIEAMLAGMNKDRRAKSKALSSKHIG